MVDTSGKNQCLIKMAVPHMVVAALVDGDTGEDPLTWNQDCGGSWDACSVLPFIYHMNEEPVQAEAVGGEAIEDFNPFEEEAVEEDEPEYATEEEERKKIAAPLATNVNKKLDSKTGSTASTPEKDIQTDLPGVKVSVHQVSNPYLVKCDVLVYPTNNMLDIDDDVLNKMSVGAIQRECYAQRGRGVKMGEVYVTSNGGPKSAVKAKSVFHAVVAGSSRLVNEQDVSRAVSRALAMASQAGAESVALLPGDCGTLDIYATALSQMSSIYRFIQASPDTAIKNIFVVMQDEPSYQVFNEYHRRIFQKKTKKLVATT